MVRFRYYGWFVILLMLVPLREFGISSDLEERPKGGSEAVLSLTGNAQRRLALVIGNANYGPRNVLLNPLNDARDMTIALRDVGFEVISYEDRNQTQMKQAIADFGTRLATGAYEVGLFYYAGHGLQVQGINYLVPVDADLRMEEMAELECVRADRVLAQMKGANTSVKIIILDACRDNPFEGSWSRGRPGAGLASMNAPTGTLIGYATAPGRTAPDGDGYGRNSLYTAAILEQIRKPGLLIENLFKEVRRTVRLRSGDRQQPWEHTSLEGDFYFRERPSSTSTDNGSQRVKSSESPSASAAFPYPTRTFNGLTWTTKNIDVETPDSWCYDNDPANCARYGRLYTWEAAKKACAALGPGWRLPTDAEWSALSASYGNISGAYKNLIEGGSSGFSALLGGDRDTDGSFSRLEGSGFYWSATEDGSDKRWFRTFHRYRGTLTPYYSGGRDGFSCRCVQSNNTTQPASTPALRYPTRTFNGLTWTTKNIDIEAPDSWCYDNDPSNCAKYGRLYTWEAAKKACVALGPGWRLPTDAEWKRLTTTFGGYYDWTTDTDVGDPKRAYSALLEGGDSGFSARLGGARNTDDSFNSRDDFGSYWSATENGSDLAWGYYFNRYDGKLYRLDYVRRVGVTCRCVQGAPSNGID